MKKALLALVFALGGCASALRLDVTCIAGPQGPTIVINCADAETWKEYYASQQAKENL